MKKGKAEMQIGPFQIYLFEFFPSSFPPKQMNGKFKIANKNK